MALPPDGLSLGGKDDNLTPVLRTAVEHLRAGRQVQAQKLLAQYVMQVPDSEQGWFLLSFAVTEPKHQIECLQRALTVNPSNTAAGARLARLQAAQQPLQAAPPASRPTSAAPVPHPAAGREQEEPPARPSGAFSVPGKASAGAPSPAPTPPGGPEATPAPGRQAKSGKPGGCGRFLRCGMILVLILLFLGVIGGAVMAYSAYLAASQPVVVPVASVVPVTLPPTWTPTLTPEPSLTPTLTVTPTQTPTRTPVPPEPTTAAVMEQIGREVADLRGLAPKGAVAGYVVSQDDVYPILEASFLASGGTQEALDDEARVLSALGLIKPTYNLYTNSLNSLTDSLGGFYFPWNQQVYVIGSRFSGVEHWVYSHEFAHALVDQHFNFGDAGVYPTCVGSQDRCSAMRALVEGDATLVMQQWLSQYASPSDYQDILNYQAPAQTLPEQYPPDYLVQEGEFPYVAGLEFVSALHARGNWAAVNRAFENPPSTTEQVLHVQKYLLGEQATPVAAVDLSSILDDSWRKLDENTLGEWTTFLLLGYGADLEAQLDLATADAAAQGWGGDVYQVYYDDADDQTLMVLHWVWDSAADAGSFGRAMTTYLNARFRGGEVDLPDEDCWQANRELTCLYTSGRDTLWILAPDESLLQAVRSLYADIL
jgi:hypothetical protein